MKTIASLTRALAVGSMMLTASAFANTAKIFDTANDGVVDTRGGEFYAVTDANGSFYTFCLERFTSLSYGVNYTYGVSNRAFSGGGDLHDPSGPGAAGDPISQGTAYLYEQFAKGILMDSDGTGSYWDQHDLNAGLLQQAFWTLEDERDYGLNPYVSYVKSLFGDEGAFSSYTGGAVAVMNLWGTNGKDVQSQLIYTARNNVSDTGATLMLLALGFGCLVAFRGIRSHPSGWFTSGISID